MEEGQIKKRLKNNKDRKDKKGSRKDGRTKIE